MSIKISGFMANENKPNTERLIFSIDNAKFNGTGTNFGWGIDSLEGDSAYVRKMILKPFDYKRLTMILKTVSGEMMYKEVSLDDFKPSFDDNQYMTWQKEFTIEGLDGVFDFFYVARLEPKNNTDGSVNDPFAFISIEYHPGTIYVGENGGDYLSDTIWNDDGTYCDGTAVFLI